MNMATQNYLLRVFKMLSNARRLEIVDLLARSPTPLCVTEIMETLKMEQSSLSTQLTRLRENKIIKARQDGLHMYYMLSDPNIDNLLRQFRP